MRSLIVLTAIAIVAATLMAGPAGASSKTRFYYGYGFSSTYRFKYPTIVRNLLCIHQGEGSWSDPDSPYWGGLQMDLPFQQTYAPRHLRREGTADHWSAVTQLRTGVKAVLRRGYSPWPNTAHDCGLL